MTELAGETTTVEQTVKIAASPELVWAFWTEPARLTEWWGPEVDLVAEPGGILRVVMENGAVMLGAFTELDPPTRVAFTFGWEHNAPGELLAPASTLVEVTLHPDGDGTELVLRHSQMPTSHAADHAQGWQHFVGERLVAVASG